MCFHLAATDHSAYDLVIDAILCAAGICTEIIADNLADLFVEGHFVFVSGNVNGCCHLA